MDKVEIEIKRLIKLNEDNKPFLGSTIHDQYNAGYFDGYHDALVDLMEHLNIKHEEEFYNN